MHQIISCDKQWNIDDQKSFVVFLQSMIARKLASYMYMYPLYSYMHDNIVT